MDQYVYFAAVYDTFMEEVPRDKWTAFIKEKLDEYGIRDGIMLDLGCGTGVMTKRFANLGYDMIGVDSSEEMLSIAREAMGDDDILYLCQDFTNLELYGTVAAVVSTCDCLNYITEKDDLLKVFKLVNNYLEKDGLFIFDINTEYKYKELLADNVFAEDAEDSAFIWQNEYDAENKLNRYGLTLFISEDIVYGDDFEEINTEDDNYLEDEDEAFLRFYEEHVQRAYSLDEIKDLLKQAGMEFVDAFCDYEERCVDEKTERITIIAKEGYQEGKYYE